MNLLLALDLPDQFEEDEEVPRMELPDISNVLDMPTIQFVENFRVTKEIFSNILSVLEHKWKKCCHRTCIRPDMKLATFLRFMATGSYQQTVGNEDVSLTNKAAVCNIISECLNLFENFICAQWIKMPLPEEEMAIKEGFFEKYAFPGIIGCVDGIHIRIKAPDTEDKCIYYNKKGFYSINAMLICDHNMRIMAVDARYPGSNDDLFIWECSVINHQLKRDYKAGKKNTWILGDSEYKLLPYLMIPFRNPVTIYERLYNQKLLSAHNVVKMCIGMAKNRFHCINRSLNCESKMAKQIINVCCALHNMCIKHKYPEEPNALSEEITEVLNRTAAKKKKSNCYAILK